MIRDLNIGTVCYHSIAVTERPRLRDILCPLNADRESALRNRYGIHRDLAAHDNRPRALVYNDARDVIWADQQILDRGDKADHVPTKICRDCHVHAPGIARLRDAAVLRVDRPCHARCRRKVRTCKRERQLPIRADAIILNRTLDDARIHSNADRRKRLRHTRAASGG